VKPSWFGESIGHYEGGDTLVVDTIGLAGGTNHKSASWAQRPGRGAVAYGHGSGPETVCLATLSHNAKAGENQGSLASCLSGSCFVVESCKVSHVAIRNSVWKKDEAVLARRNQQKGYRHAQATAPLEAGRLCQGHQSRNDEELSISRCDLR
jgi:hypothetical protein